jgi:hypothetical protein
MPTARIITSTPEFSGGLVRDLNTRGFEVQILSPEQPISGQADLEIKFEVAASSPAIVEAPAPPKPAVTPEDVWTMLAAFDGEAKTQETAPANEAPSNPPDTISAAQPSSVMQPAIADVIHSEHAAATDEAPAASTEATPSSSIDSELVPSMFGLSSDQSDSGTGGGSRPRRRTSNFSRLKLENKFWDVRSTKITTAVACAAMVLLAIVSLVHRRTPLPATNAPESQTSLPFHPAAAAPTTATATVPVAPVKAVVLKNSHVSAKPAPGVVARNETDHDEIAKDTIIRFSDTGRRHTSTTTKKENGVRYYSDME